MAEVAVAGGVLAVIAGQAMGTVVGVIIGQTVAPLLAPVAQAGQQVAYSAWPNLRLGIGEAVAARYREIISDERYTNDLQAQGISEERSDWIYQAGESLLNGMELIALKRRTDMRPGEFYVRAKNIRWSNKGIDDLAKVTEYIPGPADIISFAVREVYSPEIAEAFGQYEGADGVIAKARADIEAIGMVPDTFRKFWAAHWMLPSVGQGFEMMHRNVIPVTATEGEPLSLERLMVALDIMPAWRDKLTAISYNPYTRVDVRRMHKLGIIDDEDLPRAYLDLGFDKNKAQGMTDFTIAYNAEPPESDQTEDDKFVIRERDLTKTDILNGYRDGLLDDGEVKTALTLLGYSPAEQEYYIDRIAYNKERDETDLYLKYYHDAYIRGVMDFNQITDKLGELNLPAKRIEYLFGVWDLEKMARTNRPTKSELMTFRRKDIIDDDTFNNEMRGHQYSQRYIEWYRRTL